MKRAAEELGVSPGAVSQQIKTLEEALGLQLVFRNTTGLRLTQFGERYHRETSRILDDLRRTHRDLLATRISSGLVVSGLPLLTSKWLAPNMLEWQSLHTDVSLHVEGSIAEPSLESAQVDFRVSYRDRIKHFESGVPLYTECLVPVCSPALLEGGPPLEHPSDLKAHRLLTIDWTPLLSPAPTWADWFAAAGVPQTTLEPRDTFVFTLSSLAIEAAIDGRGVALAQLSLISDDLRNHRLVMPFQHRLPLPSPYFLAWRAGVFSKHGAREFQRWLIGIARRQQEQIGPGGQSGEASA